MSGLGSFGTPLLDLTHQPAHVLPRVPGQVDDVTLPHPFLHGVGHDLGEGVEGVVIALLGGVLSSHRLPQAGDGLFGRWHAVMFAHRGGHMEVRPNAAFLLLACGHMHVASWMCAKPP